MIEDQTKPPIAAGWVITSGGDAGSPLAITWLSPYRVARKNVSNGTGHCRSASS
jgi:hypothetical protein